MECIQYTLPSCNKILFVSHGGCFMKRAKDLVNLLGLHRPAGGCMSKFVKFAVAAVIASSFLAFAQSMPVSADSESGGFVMGGGNESGGVQWNADSEAGGIKWGEGNEGPGVLWGEGNESKGPAAEWGRGNEGPGVMGTGESDSGGVVWWGTNSFN